MTSCGHLTADRPNILFIAIDDLRPELGTYGSDIVQSPHLDKLAADGLRFDRAYCQQAICGPSRASIMTGARPDTTGVIENFAHFKVENPSLITLPRHLIAQGYETVQVGKIYHGRFGENESWSRLPAKVPGLKRPVPGGWAIPENQQLFQRNKREVVAKYGVEGSSGLAHGPAVEAGPYSDETYRDGYNTTIAVETLKELPAGEKPWFFGMGFYKPHLPFIAPKRYWDLYDPADIVLAEQVLPPQDGAAVGLHASFELRTRADIPKAGPIDDELSRELLHAYYACISYVDAQIGRILTTLEETGQRDNTIIIVWGDHGWHLGEYGVWGKATNYEIATRVPLMIWTPDMDSAVRGQGSDALVELVDMYPTLCDLVGVPRPEHLEGESMVPLLENPTQAWKPAAFSQFPSPALREWAANPLSVGMRQTFFGPLISEVEERIQAQQGDLWERELFENHLMGYAVRSQDHRLVVWRDYRDPSAEPVFVELYDHRTDPAETINIAADQPATVQELMAMLESGGSTSFSGQFNN